MKRGVASTLCGLVLVMLMMLSSTDIPKCAAQMPPPPFCIPAVRKLSVCLKDVYYSIRHWKLKLSSACCEAVNGVEVECIVHAIPFSPFSGDEFKAECKEESSTITTALGLDHHQEQQLQNSEALLATNEDSSTAAAPSSTEIQLFKKEIDQCLSTIKSIEGCLAEVVKSFLSAQIQILGPACCKAVTEVEDKCWPEIFPFNPFFPPLLKNHCYHLVVHVAAAAPIPGELLPASQVRNLRQPWVKNELIKNRIIHIHV